MLIYGPNGAGKTSVARALATRARGLHIEIDAFSSMQRGRAWYTRANCREKMALVLGALDAACHGTRRDLFLDGVLIYRFMFNMIRDWCGRKGFDFRVVKLVGDGAEMSARVQSRASVRKDLNALLPDIYRRFTYSGTVSVDVTGLGPEEASGAVAAVCGVRAAPPLRGGEYSFGMLKPDCVARGLEHEAFRRIERAGLCVIAAKRAKLDEAAVDVLYGEIRHKAHFEGLKYYLLSSEVVVFLAVGADAVRRLNSVVGFTDPAHAKPGTLRELGRDVRANIAHSASDAEQARQSAAHFFTDPERRHLGVSA